VSVRWIQSLDELKEFTERHPLPPGIPAVDTYPLRSPGLNDSQLGRLQDALPDLPAEYLQIAQAYLLDIELGGVRIGPTGPRGDVVDRLIEANGESNPFLALLEEIRFYEVARFESDPVCVGRASGQHAGSVIWLDTTDDPHSPARRMLASDFENFLIIAGRYQQAFLEEGDFADAVEASTLTEEQRATWSRVAEWL
jgi:hypothetical protein